METDLIYHVEFILNGDVAFEAEALMPDQIQEQIIPIKRRGRKPNSTKQGDSGTTGTIISLIQTGQEIQAQAASGSNAKSKQPAKAQKKGKGKNLKKRKISDEDDDLDDFEESLSNKKPLKYKEEPLLKKKLKKGRRNVIQSDDDENENDLQGSEDEAKLLELEGELEEELAHVGEDGEDVDNFEEEDENEDDDDDRLEDYVAQERPLNILLKSQRKKDQLQEPISDSNLSEDPNYQKLTKRQKNIVKNNISGQPEPGEYLQLPNNSTKGNKNGSKQISEEDQLKKLEKDEKRREQMQKQMEDLKRQTVDKILNEAGTKQKKRKEKEDMEKDNRVNHQYRQLPPNEPRIRILSNATTTQVSITPTVYHSILNPNPVVILNNVEPAIIINNVSTITEPAAQLVQPVNN